MSKKKKIWKMKRQARKVKINVQKKSNNSNSDLSPPRKRRESPGQNDRKYDSDQSLPRKESQSRDKGKRHDSDESPPRKKDQRSKKSYDSDQSPTRKSQEDQRLLLLSIDSDVSPPRKVQKEKKRRKSPDSDQSPPRKRDHRPKERRKPCRCGDCEKEKQDSDASPSRRHDKRRKSPKNNSDSDMSPPRRHKSKRKSPDNPSPRNGGSDYDLSPPRRNDSSPPTHKKMARTLEGKLAGLQDAGQLRQENEAFRRREEEAFGRMNDEVSGMNAKAESRKAPRTSCTGGAPNNLPPGENIRISRDGSVARRVESFCKGVAFSARPVRVNEKPIQSSQICLTNLPPMSPPCNPQPYPRRSDNQCSASQNSCNEMASVEQPERTERPSTSRQHLAHQTHQPTHQPIYFVIGEGQNVTCPLCRAQIYDVIRTYKS